MLMNSPMQQKEPLSSYPQLDNFQEIRQCLEIPSCLTRGKGSYMATGVKSKKASAIDEEQDYSLNDVLLRGRVSKEAVQKELPSGDKVVEFRLIITRDKLTGVDTLDIGAWSAKSRRSALTLKADEWVEISGSIHRRFWSAPTGLASRWQVEAVEITRI
jgi:single-strand DNA-binding protein